MPDLETLGRRIKQVQYRHHRALDAGLAAVGTTLAQWDALRAIGRIPGASAHTLAIETFQSDQSFGALANRLVSKGLIERRPGRGRRIEHHLTPTGATILAIGHPVAEAVLRSSFADLSEKERSTLLALLLRTATEEPDEDVAATPFARLPPVPRIRPGQPGPPRIPRQTGS